MERMELPTFLSGQGAIVCQYGDNVAIVQPRFCCQMLICKAEQGEISSAPSGINKGASAGLLTGQDFECLQSDFCFVGFE